MRNLKKDVFIKSYKREKSSSSSLTFDGVNDNVGILHNSKFNLTGNLTLECWVYLANYSDFNMLITKTLGNGATNGTFEFRTEQNTGRLRFLQATTSLQFVTSTASVPLNKWSHVAVTKTGTTVRLFIDFNLVATGTIAGTVTTNTQPIRIGARNDFGNFFKGQIQEVRLWNVARTAEEIRRDSRKSLIGNEPGLVAYYKLNEGQGTKAFDSIVPTPSKPTVNANINNFSADPWNTTLIAPITKREYRGLIPYGADSITSNLNAGYKDVSFRIPAKFDDFGEGETVGLDGFEVEIVTYDEQSTTGQIIFSGEIFKITGVLGSNEDIQILAVGPVTRLSKTPLVVAGSYTPSYNDLDHRDVFLSIIQNFISLNFLGLLVDYTVSPDHASLEFSGGQYVALPNLGLDGNPSHTVEAVINLDSYSNFRFIFAAGTNQTRRGVELAVSPTGRLLYGFFADGLQTDSGVIELNKTYHVAGRWDSSTNVRSIFVNGVKVAEDSTTSLTLADINYNIGWREFNDVENKFDGEISEVRVWNTARTDDEIFEYYNKELPQTEINDDLLGYYKMNEGQGNTIFDSSPNSADGTATSFTGDFWNDKVFGPARAGDSIEPTFAYQNYNFNNTSCLSAIKAVFDASPADFSWFIDVDTTFRFKKISRFPKHYFFVSKDIVKLEFSKNKLNVNNVLGFWDGGSNAREYRNEESVNKYGLFYSKKRDGRFSNTESIDSAGRRFVENGGDPTNQVTIEVIGTTGGGVDLESIKVGDTCRVLNIAETSALTNNMIMTQKDDSVDSATLTIADSETFISRELNEVKSQQTLTNYQSGPSSYSVV